MNWLLVIVCAAFGVTTFILVLVTVLGILRDLDEDPKGEKY